mmetsp:Transcript_5981/g.16749  ORF Transcript_5981/g.16749 Transcript_5981/m.16749 type:complete len:757 (-) Transcript_5981:69-2339(-)
MRSLVPVLLLIGLAGHGATASSCEYVVSVTEDGPLGLAIGAGFEILSTRGLAKSKHDALRKAKLQDGDKVVALNGESTEGWRFKYFLDQLRQLPRPLHMTILPVTCDERYSDMTGPALPGAEDSVDASYGELHWKTDYSHFGSYELAFASFSGPTKCSAAPEYRLVRAQPAKGCQQLKEGLHQQVPYAGSVVIIERGDCSFSVKAINAALAGAISVIVVNSEEATDIQPMPRDPMYMPGKARMRVPVAMISFEDGKSLLHDDAHHETMEPLRLTLYKEERCKTQDEFDELTAPIVAHSFSIESAHVGAEEGVDFRGSSRTAVKKQESSLDAAESEAEIDTSFPSFSHKTGRLCLAEVQHADEENGVYVGTSEHKKRARDSKVRSIGCHDYVSIESKPRRRKRAADGGYASVFMDPGGAGEQIEEAFDEVDILNLRHACSSSAKKAMREARKPGSGDASQHLLIIIPDIDEQCTPAELEAILGQVHPAAVAVPFNYIAQEMEAEGRCTNHTDLHDTLDDFDYGRRKVHNFPAVMSPLGDTARALEEIDLLRVLSEKLPYAYEILALGPGALARIFEYSMIGHHQEWESMGAHDEIPVTQSSERACRVGALCSHGYMRSNLAVALYPATNHGIEKEWKILSALVESPKNWPKSDRAKKKLVHRLLRFYKPKDRSSEVFLPMKAMRNMHLEDIGGDDDRYMVAQSLEAFMPRWHREAVDHHGIFTYATSPVDRVPCMTKIRSRRDLNLERRSGRGSDEL